MKASQPTQPWIELGVLLSKDRTDLLYYITRSYNQEEKHCSVNKTSQYIVYLQVYIPSLLVLHVHSHSHKSTRPHEKIHIKLRSNSPCPGSYRASPYLVSTVNRFVCINNTTQRTATQCNAPRSIAVYIPRKQHSPIPSNKRPILLYL